MKGCAETGRKSRLILEVPGTSKSDGTKLLGPARVIRRQVENWSAINRQEPAMEIHDAAKLEILLLVMAYC